MPDFGDGSARDNYGALDQNAPSVANGQISPAQYAEYQSRRRWDAILGVLGVLGATTGLGALGGALGGAGAAGSAAGGSGGALASGSLPPVAGGAPWAITPYATSATMAGTGAGAVAGGAGAGGGLLAGLSGRDLAGLGMGLAGTIGGAMSNQADTTPTSATQDPQMKALLDMMMNRIRKSEPNFDSAQAMAQGLLPTQYQRGGGGMG